MLLVAVIALTHVTISAADTPAPDALSYSLYPAYPKYLTGEQFLVRVRHDRSHCKGAGIGVDLRVGKPNNAFKPNVFDAMI